jgi:hypothetical protein
MSRYEALPLIHEVVAEGRLLCDSRKTRRTAVTNRCVLIGATICSNYHGGQIAEKVDVCRLVVALRLEAPPVASIAHRGYQGMLRKTRSTISEGWMSRRSLPGL